MPMATGHTENTFFQKLPSNVPKSSEWPTVNALEIKVREKKIPYFFFLRKP